MTLSKIEVLPPELVPTEESAISWRRLKSHDLSDLARRNTDSLTATGLIDFLLDVSNSMRTTLPAKSSLAAREEDTAHDAYFCISRVEGDSISILIRMAIRARLILAEEFMDPNLAMPGASWQAIDGSVIDLLCMLLGDNLASAIATVPEAGAARIVSTRQRWIRGHQIFATLTQGLLFSLRSMVQSIRTGDAKATMRHADLSVSLLRGSRETFLFTGDFSPEDYMQIIRPSMMPPAVPIGLSGLMSIDHRSLVQLFREIRPSLKQLRDHYPMQHDALLLEFSKVYDSHIHVCENFVGKLPSIRTANSTEKSGPELLQNFRTLRLKPFEHN